MLANMTRIQSALNFLMNKILIVTVVPKESRQLNHHSDELRAGWPVFDS
jgi:hypothetical protein